MKKIFALIMSAALVLCGCNGDNADSSSAESNESIDQSNESVAQSNPSDSSEPMDESSAPNFSVPEEDEEKQLPRLIIGGIEVTADNRSDVFGDGTVKVEYSKDDDTYFITLDNAKIECDVLPDSPEMESVNGIISDSHIQITLIGENEIIYEYSAPDYIWCRGITYTGDGMGSLTVTGTGSLDMNLGGKDNLSVVYGIDYKSVIIAENTTVDIKTVGGDAIGVSAWEMSVGDGGALTVDVDSNAPILGVAMNVSDISVNGGELEVIDRKDEPNKSFSMSSFMFAPEIYVGGNGRITLRGHDTVFNGNYFRLSCGKYLPKVLVSDNFHADLMGRMPDEAEIIYGEIIGLAESKYISVQGGNNDRYNLWVGGVNVTTENASDIFDDGSVSFDGDCNLILNNAEITGGDVVELPYVSMEYAVYFGCRDSDLSLKLLGNNTVSCSSKDVGISCGISTQNTLTVSSDGEGKLTVNAGEGNGMYGYSCGIQCGDYRQNSGEVNAFGEKANAPSPYGASYGIYSYRNVNVSGGKLYAQCGNAEFCVPVECQKKEAPEAEIEEKENSISISVK